MPEEKPTPKDQGAIINEGSVMKGGQNPTSQITSRPPPPAPTKPKK